MANEKLVSSVRYNGITMGVAEIIIEDTSNLSTYSFRVYNGITDAATDPQNFVQLSTYVFRITDNNPSNQPKDIYLRWYSPDGKLLLDAASSFGTPITRDETFTIPANGVGHIILNTDFFPSVLGYTGQLSFYHDNARTLLIRTYNITVQPLNDASIKVIPERLVTNTNSYPPSIIMGENLSVIVNATGSGAYGNTNRNSYYAGAVGTSPLNASQFIVPVSELAMKVTKPTTINYTGTQTLGTNIQPVGTDYEQIQVRMGEVVGQNWLIGPGFVNASPYTQVTTPVSVNLLHRSGTFTDYAFFFGQGRSSSTSYKNGFLNTVTFTSNSYPTVTIGAYPPTIGDGNTTNLNRAWDGTLSPLAFRPNDLTTLASRAQFAKYQKVITRFYDRDISWVRTYEWKDLTDSISDAQYGTLSDLKNSDLVVLPQAQGRAEVVRIWFSTNTKINIEVAWAPNGSGGSTYYTGNVSVLFLRSSEMLENHDPGTPYPRVIKAGRAPINNGVCTIDIPSSSSINLTQPRYVIQHGIEAGGDAYSISNDTTVVTQPKRITLNSVTNVSGVYTRHYAIWDLGPNVTFPTK